MNFSRTFGAGEEAHYEALARSGFFGEQAAGCIPMSRTSGRILLVKRSPSVEQPGTWGNPGGAHHRDEEAADAAVRELREETGFGGAVHLIPLPSFRAGSFTYSNFLAIVENEFTPELNWEADDFRWCAFDDLPRPLHFGVEALFGESSRWLPETGLEGMHQHVAAAPRCRLSPSPNALAWLAGTKIVDEAGKPLVAYHGTAWNFDRFDASKAGSGRGFAAERAIFFTFDPWTATHSAIVAGAGYSSGVPTHTGAMADNSGVVYPVFLRAEKPCVSYLDRYRPAVMSAQLAEAQEAGWDAVIFPHIQTMGERGTIAVFSPDQVRSVFA